VHVLQQIDHNLALDLSLGGVLTPHHPRPPAYAFECKFFRFQTTMHQRLRVKISHMLLFTLLPKQSNRPAGRSQGLSQGGGSSSQVI